MREWIAYGFLRLPAGRSVCHIQKGTPADYYIGITGGVCYTPVKAIAFELESMQGCNVLQCVYNELAMELTSNMLENLKNAHLKKIDMSEAIYVVDINGYIGEQVKQEIEYAKKKGKKITSDFGIKSIRI